MIDSRGRLARVLAIAAALLGAAVLAPAPADAATSYVIRFSGVRHVYLGETLAALKRAGYTGGPTTFGCGQYTKHSTGLYVTVNPTTRRVVAVDPLGDPRYRTAAGIHIGSSLRAVRNAYRGHVIENHLDGSFGQGADGVLVRSAHHNRWLGFRIVGHKVAGIKLGRHRFASANEVSC